MYFVNYPGVVDEGREGGRREGGGGGGNVIAIGVCSLPSTAQLPITPRWFQEAGWSQTDT
jgi:hypothetical protein